MGGSIWMSSSSNNEWKGISGREELGPGTNALLGGGLKTSAGHRRP